MDYNWFRHKNKKKQYIKKRLIMEIEYDFSKGARGKFYKKDGQSHLLVYL
jgi:hypothetical protein